jgi:predicted metal-dependent hydrolase
LKQFILLRRITTGYDQYQKTYDNNFIKGLIHKHPNKLLDYIFKALKVKYSRIEIKKGAGGTCSF